MTRPFPLRLAPIWLRTKFYYYLYRAKTKRPDLFQSASLSFAPDLRMDLHPTDEGHSQIAFTGFYELALTRRIVLLVRRLDGGPGAAVSEFEAFPAA